MPWPLASNFSAILANPRFAFRDPQLQACRIERNAIHQPRVWSGSFAVVYKASDSQGKAWAIRAFTSESRERREHYERITEHLKKQPARCLVDFDYREAAIRSAGDGKWYPLVVMDWVEGSTLFTWAGAKCRTGKGASLAMAVKHWLALVQELEQLQIAYGDLQHGNVLVTSEGRLKLVDYDGMCVPALVGRRNVEIGVRPYQHAQRNESTLLSPQLDNFSALVIYVALRALAADPSLWLKHVDQTDYDTLLFRKEDFLDCERSPLFRDLQNSPDKEVPRLAAQLFAYAHQLMEMVPPLREVVPAESGDGPVAKVSPAQESPARQAPAAKTAPAQAGGPRLAWEEVSLVPASFADRPASRLILEVVAGPLQGQALAVERHETLLVGRGADCGLRLANDPRVSRHHFLLEVVPPQARLRDLGSRNGTYVNGVRYGGREARDQAVAAPVSEASEVDVKHGDQVTVGRTVIQIRVEGLAGKPASVPAPAPSSEPTAPRDKPLRLIERLEFGRVIGRGSLGKVYEAVHKDDQSRFAVKIVEPRAEIGNAERRRVLEELAGFQQLQHPHIVGLRESGLLGRSFYLVLEYCDSGGLDQWLQEQGSPPSLSVARPLMLQCLLALETAHQAGRVHGDLKPQNILLHRRGGKLTARISDFGSAWALERVGFSGLTTTSQVQQRFHFLARERLREFHECRPESDQWSLAAVFYHLLSGQLPFDFRGGDPIAIILNREPVPLRERNPRLPQAVAQVIDRALSTRREQRFRAAGEMKTQLQRAFAMLRGS
jgi:eukaryotic-like serine/threonine-protein kinase